MKFTQWLATDDGSLIALVTVSIIIFLCLWIPEKLKGR